jgi:hypothetical protein
MFFLIKNNPKQDIDKNIFNISIIKNTLVVVVYVPVYNMKVIIFLTLK